MLKKFDKKNAKCYNFVKGEKMDKELLLRLFRIGNPSGKEEKVSDFVKEYFDKMGIEYEVDDYGNIFNLSDSSLPILNAHMDSVQDDIDSSLSDLINIRGNIMSGYGVIGGDDKCGIFVILEVLKKRKVNFIITREEEIGCVGINYFMSHNDIKRFPWALTLDRYGSSDIICYDNDYGTAEFENALSAVGERFGYKPNKGVYSDADYISEDVSCANVSVGYYAHHSKKEYVVLSDLQNSINFVVSAIDNIKQDFEAPVKYHHRGTRGFSGANPYSYDVYDYYSDYDDYDFPVRKTSSQKCFVTKKVSSNLVFIPSLNEYISPEGAQSIMRDLEESGILYDAYFDYKDYDDDDIDKILEGVM